MAGKMRIPSIREGLNNKLSRVQRNRYSLMAAATVGMLQITPTLCAPTMEAVFRALIDIIADIFFWVGAVMTVIAIGGLLLALKDQNPDSQTRNVTYIVIGIALIGFKALANPIINLLI